MKNVLNQLIRAAKYGIDWLLRSAREDDSNGHEGYFINMHIVKSFKASDHIGVQRDSVFKGFGMNAVTLVQEALKHTSQFIDKSLREGFLRETQDVGELHPWEKHDTVKVDAELRDWHIRMDHRNVETYVVGKIFGDTKGRFPDGYEVSTSAIEYLDIKARIVKTKNSVYKLSLGEPEHV